MAPSTLAPRGKAWAQEPESEAVSHLRRTLQATYADPAERDRALKQCLAELHSLADWQGAAVLAEWRLSFSDAEMAAVDRANQAAALDRFRSVVRNILGQGDPARVAGTMEMLGRMAARARGSGEPLTLVRDFAPELVHLVVQGPPRLRGLAARTLAQIEPPVSLAVPALTGLLQVQEDELRLAAAESLALLLQYALQATNEPEGVTRPGRRGALLLVASTVVPAAHRGLEDVRPEVRRRCLKTIGLACTALTRLLDEPSLRDDSSARRPLQTEYEELRPLLLALRDQGPTLERFLHDSDPETRILTHKTLEEMGVARDRWLRRCAACQDNTGEPLLDELLHEALPGLAEALAHPDVRVRRSALDVLETSGSLALPALPALTRALRDPDRFVRWSAVRTVGKLGPSAAPGTVPDLTPLLRDQDPDLRKAAANALERLRSPQSR